MILTNHDSMTPPSRMTRHLPSDDVGEDDEARSHRVHPYRSTRTRGSINASRMSDRSVPTMVRNE